MSDTQGLGVPLLRGLLEVRNGLLEVSEVDGNIGEDVVSQGPVTRRRGTVVLPLHRRRVTFTTSVKVTGVGDGS